VIVSVKNIFGKIIKNNVTYLLEDNCTLNNIVLSKTILHVGKETTGHSHKGIEEIYFFHSGIGRIKIGKTEFNIEEGNIAIIPDGEFHKVFNDGKEDLIFLSVFQTYNR